jgi:hypothetical protein
MLDQKPLFNKQPGWKVNLPAFLASFRIVNILSIARKGMSEGVCCTLYLLLILLKKPTLVPNDIEPCCTSGAQRGHTVKRQKFRM